jgi:Protein of unknown function (DUF1571)
MKRWRLIVVPVIVVAVGLWASSFQSKPLEVKPGKEPIADSGVSEMVIDKPKAETLEKILETDPIQFLEMSLKRYDETIKGYEHILDKHERIQGKLARPEKVRACFREMPYAVYMEWIEGAGLASKVLYVAGEHRDKKTEKEMMLARGWGPLKFFGIQTREVDGADAKSSGRFTIAQFGFKKSTERSLASMKRAKERGTLHVKYEGIVPVEKLGGQKCHKFVRTPYDPHEEDDLNELTLYYDTEHWLQVGAILKDVKGQLLGEYFFTELKFNPEFNEKQFTRDAL